MSRELFTVKSMLADSDELEELEDLLAGSGYEIKQASDESWHDIGVFSNDQWEFK